MQILFHWNELFFTWSLGNNPTPPHLVRPRSTFVRCVNIFSFAFQSLHDCWINTRRRFFHRLNRSGPLFRLRVKNEAVAFQQTQFVYDEIDNVFINEVRRALSLLTTILSNMLQVHGLFCRNETVSSLGKYQQTSKIIPRTLQWIGKCMLSVQPAYLCGFSDVHVSCNKLLEAKRDIDPIKRYKTSWNHIKTASTPKFQGAFVCVQSNKPFLIYLRLVSKLPREKWYENIHCRGSFTTFLVRYCNEKKNNNK